MYMENPKWLNRSTPKARRSGNDSSDMETEWHDTDDKKNTGDGDIEKPHFVSDQTRNISRLRLSRRLPAFEHEVSSPIKTSKASPVRRRHSMSPYKPQRDDGNVLPLPPGRRNISPLLSRPGSEIRNNVSPFSKSEHKRHASPYKPTRENHGLGNDEIGGLNRKQIHRVIEDDSSRVTEKSNYSRRSSSAPSPRQRDKDQQIKYDHGEQKRRGRTPSLLPRNIPPKEREAVHKNTPSVGEINEIMANAKISRGLVDNALIMESTESISPGDIFFSCDYGAVTMQKIIFPKNGGFENILSPKFNRFTEKSRGSHQLSNTNGTSNINIQGNSSSTVLTQTSTITSSGVSRQSSNLSDASERTNGSAGKFAANRRKSQTEAWFSCIKKGSCRTSRKSPERERAFDEASFIEKAFVVESLRQFWADKHQPASLNGFTCHKHEAQLLKASCIS